MSKVKSTIHELAFNNDVRPYVLNAFAALSALGLVRHHFIIAPALKLNTLRITFEDRIPRLCDYVRDSAQGHDFRMYAQVRIL